MRDGLVGWAKAHLRRAHVFATHERMVGTLTLCPPYGGGDFGYRQCSNRTSSQPITFPTASPNTDRITTPASS